MSDLKKPKLVQSCTCFCADLYVMIAQRENTTSLAFNSVLLMFSFRVLKSKRWF